MNDAVWNTVQFEDLAADSRNAIVGGPFGSNLVSSDYTETGVPVIRGQNMGDGRWVKGPFAFVSEDKADSLRANLARPGDIVFTQRGTLGQVALVPEGPWDRYVVSQSQMKATLNPTVADPLFVYYYFTSPSEQSYIVANAVQTGVPHSNLGQLRAHPVRVPPLPEQRAIASVLGALDDKIEQNRRTARALERLARAIFRAWFVDFEPVKAKAEGATSFPSMPQEVFDALPTRLVDSEIGPVPEGWEVKPLDDIADFLNGLALQKYPPRGDDTDLPVIKIAQLRKGSTDGAATANDSIAQKYKVNDGDLLFSWSGTLEVKFWFGGPGALNQHLFKVTSDHYPEWLVYEWIHHHMSEFRVIAASKATTMGHIKRSHLHQALAAIPPYSFVDNGDETLAPIFEMHAAAHLEARKLTKMRDYLLPKLLSGEVCA